MIRRNGYICEDHVVTTPDGYILTIHRIPVGKQHGPGGIPCKN
jgi:lysosomal acid lipase/cholesteryl ester hydrolase